MAGVCLGHPVRIAAAAGGGITGAIGTTSTSTTGLNSCGKPEGRMPVIVAWTTDAPVAAGTALNRPPASEAPPITMAGTQTAPDEDRRH